ncbi:alpha-tectorin-like [Fundulus heteroclitus]|uniref:alpha-tectorin-like n=1 Tax=Fundulus heteroclitus TaxID=8078 RepID=UPI00165C5E42|nr:alpha-tectorin-like [Fundulus heteroclitus]
MGRQYQNRVTGMCGNFNGDPTDDKVLPNGTLAQDDNHFGQSWKSETSQAGCGTTDERSGNGLSDCSFIEEYTELCRVITNTSGPFSSCHLHSDPQPFFTSCVYDLCLYTPANGMLCSAVSAYEKTCTVLGLNIPDWRSPLHCAETDPCEQLDCAEYEWCGEKDGVYGCFRDEHHHRPNNESYGGMTTQNAGGMTSQNAGGMTTKNTGGMTSHNAGGMTSQNAGGMTTQNAGGMTSQNAGGMTTQNAGGMTSQNAGGMTTQNAGGMTSQNAGGMTTQNAGGMTSHNAGGMTTHNTGGMTSHNAGGMTTQNADGMTIQNTGGMTTQNSGGMTSHNAGGMTTQNTGGMTSQNAGGMTTQNAGGMTTHNTGGMTTQNAGGMTTHNTGGMTTQNAGGMTSQNAGGMTTQNAGGMTSQNAGGMTTQNTGGMTSQNAGQLKVLPIYTEPPITTTTEPPTTPAPDPCEQLHCTAYERCGEKDGVYGCFCDEDHHRPNNESYDSNITCSSSSGIMSISRCQLFEAGFHPSALHLRDESCNGTIQDGRLVFHFDNDNHLCGTTLRSNGTHFMYENSIQGDVDTHGGLISRQRNLHLSFCCVYPLEQALSMSVGINPLESILRKKLSVGIGSYRMRMIPYLDEGFLFPLSTNRNIEMEVDEMFYVEVRTEGVDQHQLSTVLDSCWATPVNQANYPVRWDLIISQCPNPADGTVEVIQNGVSTAARFSFRMFTFTNHTEIYLHCNVHLCLLTNNNCTVDCYPGHLTRVRRDVSYHDSGSLSLGPLVLGAKQTTGAPIYRNGASGHLTSIVTLIVSLLMAI